MDDETANNTIATAGIQIPRGGDDPGIYVGTFSLANSDVDFVGIGPLVAGDIITAMTTPLEDASFGTPDTVLAVFDSAGVRIAFNDDADGFGSVIRFLVPVAGDYFIAASGFGDNLFTGLHSEQGDYVLTISVPAGVESIIDDETDNNTIATAGNQITRGTGPNAYLGAFDLGSNDVDYIGFGSLIVGDVITLVTTPIEDAFFEVPDTIISVFDAAGAQLAFNDDANGLGSASRFRVSAAGDYFLAASGFGDTLFQGFHTEEGNYFFTISFVPAPPPPTPTPTATPTASATATATPTGTPTPTPTPRLCLPAPASCNNDNDCCSNLCLGQGPNKVCAPEPTPTPTATATATATGTPTPTPTATPTPTPQPGDFDGDGVLDNVDNCLFRANAPQDDTDGDDCGNLCDADYDQSGTVGFPDFGVFTTCFSTTNELCMHVQPIGGGRVVGFPDFGFFTATFGSIPGPSGATTGTTACP